MKLYTTQVKKTVRKELRRWPQWVAWAYGEKRTDGSKAKEPISPRTGHKAKSNKPSTWGTLSEATVTYLEEEGYSGIGFMLTASDPYTVIDLDNCRDPETGEVEEWAWKIVQRFASLTMVSPSGTGLHIWVKGTLLHLLPNGKGGFNKKATHRTEAYTTKHFMTWTGEVHCGETIEWRQEELEDLYEELHPEPQALPEPSCTATSVGLTNDEVREKARNSKIGAKFVALNDRGDISVSSNNYSKADKDLMRFFAYYTRKDPAQMESLYYESALAVYRPDRNDPEKYRRKDYIQRTIDYAIKHTGKVYDPENHKPKTTRTRDQIMECVEYATLVHPWVEIAGRADAAATAYSAYQELLRMAWKANSLEIDASERDLAVGSGLGTKATTRKGLGWLEDLHGLVVKVDEGSPGHAARYRIKPVPKMYQSQIQEKLSKEFNINPHCADNGFGTFLGPWTRKLRNTSPISEKEYDRRGRRLPKRGDATVKSVGKGAAMLLDFIHAAKSLFSPGPVPIEFLVHRTSMSSKRLRERHLNKLLGAGLLEEVEGGFKTPDDVQDRVALEALISGCLSKEKRQRKVYEEQRKIHRVWRLHKAGVDFDGIALRTGYNVAEIMDILIEPDHAPTLEEMREARALHPDGLVHELEREAPEWGSFVANDEPQAPIGFDYLPSEDPTTASSNVIVVPFIGSDSEVYEPSAEKPCIHSYGPIVFPGGKGCACCDPDHPSKRATQKANEPVVTGAA